MQVTLLSKYLSCLVPLQMQSTDSLFQETSMVNTFLLLLASTRTKTNIIALPLYIQFHSFTLALLSVINPTFPFHSTNIIAWLIPIIVLIHMLTIIDPEPARIFHQLMWNWETFDMSNVSQDNMLSQYKIVDWNNGLENLEFDSILIQNFRPVHSFFWCLAMVWIRVTSEPGWYCGHQ